MSTQTLNLQSDWEEIAERFRSHFKNDFIDISEEKIEYSKPGEHLIIRKDGTVSAGMPLHSNEVQEAEKVEFVDSGVKIVSENSEYTFRR